MRWDSNSIKPGMFVVSTSGERIGKVIRCEDDDFIGQFHRNSHFVLALRLSF